MCFLLIALYNTVVNKFDIDNHNMQGKVEQIIHDNSIISVIILYIIIIKFK